MVNTHQKGARAENDVITYLHVLGITGERLRLAGTFDRSDIWVPGVPNGDGSVRSYRLEVKNHLVKNMPATMADIAVDLKKLGALFPNDICMGVIARPSKPVGEWYTVQFMKDHFGDPRTLA